MELADVMAKSKTLDKISRVLEMVGNNEMPVDVGYGLSLKILFNVNNYISLAWREKADYLNWLNEMLGAYHHGNPTKKEKAAMLARLLKRHESLN